MGKKGRLIWTQGDDEAALAEGAAADRLAIACGTATAIGGSVT
jgi:hypothetical protein